MSYYNYINGYDRPIFLIYHSSTVVERIEMSMKYQGLKEYVEETSINHKSLGGYKKTLPLYVEKFFELDYSGLAQTPDLLKVQNIWRASWAKKKIILIPHRDNEGYFYSVRLQNGQKTLGLHYGGLLSFGNKDLILYFETVEPLQDLGWQNPADRQINVSNIRQK